MIISNHSLSQVLNLAHAKAPCQSDGVLLVMLYIDEKERLF